MLIQKDLLELIVEAYVIDQRITILTHGEISEARRDIAAAKIKKAAALLAAIKQASSITAQ